VFNVRAASRAINKYLVIWFLQRLLIHKIKAVNDTIVRSPEKQASLNK